MKITFGKHIINLLKEHECVVIPNVGGLLLKHLDSHISNGQIFPSSKVVKFNKNIQNEDDLLISELIKTENFSYLEAKLKLSKFVDNLKFELSQRSYFDIEDLGRFSLTDNDEVKFIANSNISNLDKSNFGFNKINIFPVQRVIIEDKPILKTEPIDSEVVVEKDITKIKEIRKPALIGLAATLLLIFGIFSLMFSNTEIESLKVQNANVLNMFVPEKTNKRHFVEVRKQGDFQEETKKRKKKKLKKKKRSSKISDIEKETLEDVIIEDVTETESTIEPSAELKAFTENLKNKNKVVAKKEEVKKEIEEPKETKEKEEIVVAEIAEEESYTETTKTSENKPKVDILKVHDTDNPLGYYVVIGAYGSLGNANKAKYTCSIENTCRIFKTKSNMYRVAIYTTTDTESAIEIILDYKKTKSSYWLMKNQ